MRLARYPLVQTIDALVGKPTFMPGVPRVWNRVYQRACARLLVDRQTRTGMQSSARKRSTRPASRVHSADAPSTPRSRICARLARSRIGFGTGSSSKRSSSLSAVVCALWPPSICDDRRLIIRTASSSVPVRRPSARTCSSSSRSVCAPRCKRVRSLARKFCSRHFRIAQAMVRLKATDRLSRCALVFSCVRTLFNDRAHSASPRTSTAAAPADHRSRATKSSWSTCPTCSTSPRTSLDREARFAFVATTSSAAVRARALIPSV